VDILAFVVVEAAVSAVAVAADDAELHSHRANSAVMAMVENKLVSIHLRRLMEADSWLFRN
jgi:hypothetical protein